MAEVNNWIGTKESAKIIGISDSQICKMIRYGIFETAYRKTNKPQSHYLIDLNEVYEKKKIYCMLRKLKPRPGMRTLYEREKSKGC